MTTRISDETRMKIRAAWPEILQALAAGDMVKDTLARLDIKPEWLRAYRASEPSARQEWEDARENSADSFAEMALNMALKPSQTITHNDKGEKLDAPLIIRLDPAHARNAIDTLKWAARIRNPRLYSDKAQLDINVKTVDLTRIIQDANARLAAQRAPALELKPGADGVYSLAPELLALL